MREQNCSSNVNKGKLVMTMPHSSVLFDAALHAVVLHQICFMHVLLNWLLMIGTCPDLEIKYGAWRVAVLWLISCLGGNW